VNGTPYSTSFGSGDTPTTIASRLATAISAGSYASAMASGGTVNLTSKTAGTIGDYSLTASYTWNSSQFTNSSFTTSTSGAALSGAYNAGDIGNNPFVTLYAYDALGNLLRVDQKGTAPSDSTQWRTRLFTYNSFSQLLTAINPESGTITYSYDADGNLLQKTSPAPNQTGSATQTVSFCYDALHRVTMRDYQAHVFNPPNCPITAPVVSYFYDSGTNAIGHLTSLTDQAGTASYAYDILGRLAAETRSIAGVSKSTSYTYNLDGSMKTLTYPSGRVLTYTPGAAGVLLSAVDGNGTNYVASASYNPDGSLKNLMNGSTPALNQNFQYTPRLQLCRITALTSGTLPTSCTDSQHIGNIIDRGYDFHAGNGTLGSGTDNGNVFGITNYRDTTRSQSFTYDALNRLTSGWSSANTGAYSWGENYTIDAWGNLQISPMDGKAQGGNFAHSGTVQNQAAGLGYDAAGNLTNYTSLGQYVYDQENRLSSTAGITYTYDGNGERVLKSNTSTGAAVKRYWSMGGNTLAEGDGTGNLTAEYIYFGSKRIARIDMPANTVHYYLSDHLGSTSIVASAAGAIEEESDYYPFGTEVVVTTGINQYKFTAKERDVESNLDYMGTRYYGSSVGRFTTPDLKGIALRHLLNPQKLNKYSYVLNSPISFFDPNGMEELTIQLRAYIPQEHMLTYKGDNRGPTTSQVVTSRTEVKFGIETDQSKRPPGGYPPLLAPSQSKAGVTENFFTGNKAVQTEGLPAVTSAKYDDKGNAVITIQQNAVNPLSPNGTAAIRSDLTITVPADGSSVTTTGTLSGAPSFELNVFGPGGQATNIPLQTAPESTPAFAIGLYSTNTVNNTTPLPPPPPPKKGETP
jgi:RHS repeat-associated protein